MADHRMNVPNLACDDRGYPRVAIKHPLDVVVSKEVVIQTFAYDIAPGGLQIRCPQQIARQLHQAVKTTHGSKYIVGVRLVLPIGQKKVRFNAVCRIVYIKRIAAKAMGYRIGLQFTRIPTQCASHLYRFIEESLQPA